VVKNSDSNKVKNCLENWWTLGVLVEQGKQAILTAVEKHALKHFLWITSVPQHEI